MPLEVTTSDTLLLNLYAFLHHTIFKHIIVYNYSDFRRFKRSNIIEVIVSEGAKVQRLLTKVRRLGVKSFSAPSNILRCFPILKIFEQTTIFYQNVKKWLFLTKMHIFRHYATDLTRERRLQILLANESWYATCIESTKEKNFWDLLRESGSRAAIWTFRIKASDPLKKS